jgi:hypothetical protein
MSNERNQGRRTKQTGPIFAIALLLIVTTGVLTSLRAQQVSNSSSLELGMIVTATAEQAEKVIKEFKAGTDFGVLAKENSIDITADDGGYLGRMNLVQLEPDVRSAVSAIHAGQITGVIHTSDGYAVLTIFPAAPHAQHLISQREISSLVSTGVVRSSLDVGGLGVADQVFTAFQKPEGWDRDLHQICKIRKQSHAEAIVQLQHALATAEAEGTDQSRTRQDDCDAHMSLAQLYAFDGEMEKEIQQQKLALAIAQKYLPEVHTAHLPSDRYCVSTLLRDGKRHLS